MISSRKGESGSTKQNKNGRYNHEQGGPQSRREAKYREQALDWPFLNPKVCMTTSYTSHEGIHQLPKIPGEANKIHAKRKHPRTEGELND